MITQFETAILDTPTGKMRSEIYRPVKSGKFNAIIFYSEIFQITAPIKRSAQILAGLGYVVIVPEVFHELNPIGCVLAYDDAGKDKGNADKWEKSLEDHDSDTQAMVEFLQSYEFCTGKIGAMGVCIGGHLAFRAALNKNIQHAFCLYPTDIHSNTLPSEKNNDTLTRSKDIKAEVYLVFGKQDPHVPQDARLKLYQHFLQNGLNYIWLEVDAQHAFMRDEGERYDSALAIKMYQTAGDFFR
ncbi:dienelactone hydrolase family protein [Marinicellulosiphila megalodicopiae]|uniref:dienelactone hydrolase family protein n=1 Tax=Marinicellulosiphila megalodicopiae TaxID=2724896 RepID=UPI003BB1B82C